MNDIFVRRLCNYLGLTKIQAFQMIEEYKNRGKLDELLILTGLKGVCEDVWN